MPGLPSVRNWGDGHTNRSRHLIADIVYRPGIAELVCSDGTTLEATTPEDLEVLWQHHGGKLLDAEVEEQQPLSFEEAEERSQMARAAIVLMSARCTCATDDIMLCPNYLPGDEEGDFSDDD